MILTDDLARIRAVDPGHPADHGTPDPDDLRRLSRLRERVDAARAADDTDLRTPSGDVAVLPRARDWRRRAPVLVGAAAALAIAVPLGVTVLGSQLPGSEVISPSAVADDGSLQCGAGFAEAVDPADVEPRLLPSRLPAGWEVTEVFARQESFEGWCVPESLSVTRTSGDVVTGSLNVFGPFDFPAEEFDLDLLGGADDSAAAVQVLAGEIRDVTVSGGTGRLLPVFDDYTRSLWQAADGRYWIAEIDGWTTDEAVSLLDGISVDGDAIAFDAAQAGPAAAGLEVAHQRTGAPYPTTSQSVAWYVDVHDGERTYQLATNVGGAPVAPLVATATGTRSVTVNGLDAIIDEPDAEDYAGYEECEADPNCETDGPPGTWLQVRLASGETVSGSTAGDWQALAEVIASMEPVAADDPRLNVGTID